MDVFNQIKPSRRSFSRFEEPLSGNLGTLSFISALIR